MIFGFFAAFSLSMTMRMPLAVGFGRGTVGDAFNFLGLQPVSAIAPSIRARFC